jgi:hypothetical protein
MDWNNVQDATEELKLTVAATGDDPQPAGTFPVIRRGGPRDGLVMLWGRVPEGVRSPSQILMADEEAFAEYEEE